MVALTITTHTNEDRRRTDSRHDHRRRDPKRGHRILEAISDAPVTLRRNLLTIYDDLVGDIPLRFRQQLNRPATRCLT